MSTWNGMLWFPSLPTVLVQWVGSVLAQGPFCCQSTPTLEVTELIEWSNFSWPALPSWDHSKLCPFTFSAVADPFGLIMKYLWETSAPSYWNCGVHQSWFSDSFRASVADDELESCLCCERHLNGFRQRTKSFFWGEKAKQQRLQGLHFPLPPAPRGVHTAVWHFTEEHTALLRAPLAPRVLCAGVQRPTEHWPFAPAVQKDCD